jgi:hypothetical protein
VVSQASAQIEHDVRSSLVAALDAASLDREPFTHIYLQDAFPPGIYAEMLDATPELSCFRPDNPAKYGAAARKFHATPDGTPAPVSCRYTMPLDEARLACVPEPARTLWTGVSAALRSDELKQRIFSVFSADLCRRFRTDEAGLARMEAHPRPTLVRDLSG